jgi:hypothetical protein
MHKDKLEDILNSEFESVQARLSARVTQLHKESKLTTGEAVLLDKCISEAENPWLPWLYNEEDEDENNK